VGKRETKLVKIERGKEGEFQSRAQIERGNVMQITKFCAMIFLGNETLGLFLLVVDE